ncbi:uncharacterized protein N7483_010662 [Penicillium malachiteum]|uniref:uncharacterized protein n=1 Tax=Penicillium malachiteum TaxID=1324776 RepID=UPI002546C627|nr:uncharacterized protein N7483_010662 [Penicillium malachiteum]KAJ5713481.1 hypothetical protein N7483_010662 [Penicillium malachiteum]
MTRELQWYYLDTYTTYGLSVHTPPNLNLATAVIQTTYKMSRNINFWQRQMILHVIYSKNRPVTSQMAKVAQCSERYH